MAEDMGLPTTRLVNNQVSSKTLGRLKSQAFIYDTLKPVIALSSSFVYGCMILSNLFNSSSLEYSQRTSDGMFMSLFVENNSLMMTSLINAPI